MKQKMYVDANEIARDWGISKSKSYQIIKNLNNEMLKKNPTAIVLHGKANRKFYEENCYGLCEK